MLSKTMFELRVMVTTNFMRFLQSVKDLNAQRTHRARGVCMWSVQELKVIGIDFFVGPQLKPDRD